jgi:replicative DNA helicase
VTQLADTPPQNLEAEENVIGALMLSGDEALGAVAEILEPSDFSRPSHGLIYAAVLELSAASLPIEPISLAEWLEQKGQLKSIEGGRQRIHELAALVPASRNIAHHARIVKEKAAARSLITAGLNITRLGYEQPGNSEELMAQAEEALSKATGLTITSSFEPMTSAIPELDAQIKASLEGNPLRGVLTGFISLDYALAGLWPGQLVTVAARTGAGKSALAQNIAENIADRGEYVAFSTLEMSKQEIGLRGLARESGVDTKRIRWGNPPEGSREKLLEARKKVKERWSRLIVNESPGVNPTTLRAQLRQVQRRHDLSLLVVDYIQLMSSGTRQENRQQEVAAVTRALKLLAKDLNIPVLALSQMNRQIDGRAKEDRRPQLSDLRESGAIEQDSDVVIFIHRTEDDTEGGTAEIIIAKNRMGETTDFKMAYVGKKCAFTELAKGVTP